MSFITCTSQCTRGDRRVEETFNRRCTKQPAATDSRCGGWRSRRADAPRRGCGGIDRLETIRTVRGPGALLLGSLERLPARGIGGRSGHRSRRSVRGSTGQKPGPGYEAVIRYLLDTNVVSEPTRPKPRPGVLRKLLDHEDEIAIPSIVWHELRYGVARLPQ